MRCECRAWLGNSVCGKLLQGENREYELLELKHRVAEKPLPKVEVVDLREELKAGNRSILSVRLQELMEDRLKRDSR